MKKILFITPYFGRTGSEMQLYYILQHLDRAQYSPYLFSRDRGILLKELPKDIHYSVGYKKHPNLLLRLFRLLLYAVNINPTEFQIRLLHKKIKPDFWYINTIANRDAFNLAKKLKVKVVSHIHELPLRYDNAKYQTLKNMLEHSIMHIGCSKIVCEKLEDMGAKNVHLLYGFIDNSLIRLTRSEKDIRMELGLKPTDFVWVMSGSVSTTKGVDFLIPLIKRLKSNHKIIWIGSNNKKSGLSYYVEKSVKENFSERIIFTGAKAADYYSYFNVAHACLSLSREDSFPLVLQEAAHLGKPIAGFNSGGIKEFVNEKVGIVVDQQNFDEMAKAMAYVKANYSNYQTEYIKNYAKELNAVAQTAHLSQLLKNV